MRELPPRGDEAARAARANAFRSRVRGARAVVIGLGTSGVSAARLLLRLGANVVANDFAPREKLSEEARSLESAGARLVTGGHEDAKLGDANLVVISPGVPRLSEVAAAE